LPLRGLRASDGLTAGAAAGGTHALDTRQTERGPRRPPRRGRWGGTLWHGAPRRPRRRRPPRRAQRAHRHELPLPPRLGDRERRHRLGRGPLRAVPAVAGGGAPGRLRLLRARRRAGHLGPRPPQGGPAVPERKARPSARASARPATSRRRTSSRTRWATTCRT
jgi:hypothetical protein